MILFKLITKMLTWALMAALITVNIVDGKLWQTVAVCSAAVLSYFVSIILIKPKKKKKR